MQAMLKSLAVAVLLATGTLAFAQDPVTQHQTGDPAMETAMANAQASMDRVFAKTMNTSGEVHPAIFLKVAIPVSAGEITVENIWVRDAVRSDAEFAARLANAPVHFEGAAGDQVTFTKAQIVDWSLSDRGILYGNYTTRVQLPFMDPQTRDTIASQLSDDPLPTGW